MNEATALYTTSSVLAQAAAAIATLAGAKMLLLKNDFNPGFNTTLAEVLAHDADYSGYTPGGVVISAFLGPILSPGLGAAIAAPGVQFSRDGTLPGVNNLIRSWALVTAGNVLWALGVFPEDIPFQVPGQGTIVPLAFGFPAG